MYSMGGSRSFRQGDPDNVFFYQVSVINAISPRAIRTYLEREAMDPSLIGSREGLFHEYMYFYENIMPFSLFSRVCPDPFSRWLGPIIPLWIRPCICNLNLSGILDVRLRDWHNRHQQPWLLQKRSSFWSETRPTKDRSTHLHVKTLIN